MTLSVVPFTSRYSHEWDSFCRSSINHTLLHTRLFLTYHGERFEDLSLLLFDDTSLIALLPAARSLIDTTQVVSHPGATFGGFIHAGKLLGPLTIQAFRAVSAYYRGLGLSRFLYKPIPHTYTIVPAQDDIYALFRVGARRVGCNLSSAVDLTARLPLTKRRLRSLKKAKAAVTVSESASYFDALWSVIEENLAREHNARPTHSRSEIDQLRNLLASDVFIRVALADQQVVGGIIIFASKQVWHAQYIAASEKGYQLCALDAVFAIALSEAEAAGVRYFDFGTSNESDGRILNSGLYKFKSEFGGGGVAQESYELDLQGGV